MSTITEQLGESMKALETMKNKTVEELKQAQKEGNEALEKIRKYKQSYKIKADNNDFSDNDRKAYASMLLTEQDYLKGLRLIESILNPETE